MLHGSKGVIKKKEASLRINKVGLGSDILSLVNNTRDNKSNRKFHQQHKNKQVMVNDEDCSAIVMSLSMVDEMLIKERSIQIQRSEVFQEPRPPESSY